jgi:hypothetical protein
MPILENLADQTDATVYGYGTIPVGMFTRASARVRAYTGQTISLGTSTILARGPIVQLPERPVVSIDSVSDVFYPDAAVAVESGWTLRAGGILNAPYYSDNLSITYTHGFAEVPDPVVELVCAIASRLSTAPSGAAAGVQQETGGSESVTFGFDSYNAISELTTGEKRALDSIFPKRAGVTVLRP